MTDPQAERWFDEKRAEARRLAPTRYVIERRSRLTHSQWRPDGCMTTYAEAERGVRNRKDGDWDRFGRNSHEYRIIEFKP